MSSFQSALNLTSVYYKRNIPTPLHNTVETGCLALLAVKRIVLCKLYRSLLGAYAQQATRMTSDRLHEPRKKARSRLEKKHRELRSLFACWPPL